MSLTDAFIMAAVTASPRHKNGKPLTYLEVFGSDPNPKDAYALRTEYLMGRFVDAWEVKHGTH